MSHLSEFCATIFRLHIIEDVHKPLSTMRPRRSSFLRPAFARGPALPNLLQHKIYCQCSGATRRWAYRGAMFNERPSEVIPLQWPAPDSSIAPDKATQPGQVQLGFSLEPISEAPTNVQFLSQKTSRF